MGMFDLLYAVVGYNSPKRGYACFWSHLVKADSAKQLCIWLLQAIAKEVSALPMFVCLSVCMCSQKAIVSLFLEPHSVTVANAEMAFVPYIELLGFKH